MRQSRNRARTPVRARTPGRARRIDTSPVQVHLTAQQIAYLDRRRADIREVTGRGRTRSAYVRELIEKDERRRKA